MDKIKIQKTKEDLSKGFAAIECLNYRVASVEVNERTCDFLGCVFGADGAAGGCFCDESAADWAGRTIWGAEVRIDNALPDGEIVLRREY